MNDDDNDCKWSNGWKDHDLLWYYFENNGSETWTFHLTFSEEHKNIVLGDPNKVSDNKFEVVVEAGEKNYCFCKRPDVYSSCDTSFSYHSSF